MLQGMNQTPDYWRSCCRDAMNVAERCRVQSCAHRRRVSAAGRKISNDLEIRPAEERATEMAPGAARSNRLRRNQNVRRVEKQQAPAVPAPAARTSSTPDKSWRKRHNSRRGRRRAAQEAAAPARSRRRPSSPEGRHARPRDGRGRMTGRVGAPARPAPGFRKTASWCEPSASGEINSP